MPVRYKALFVMLVVLAAGVCAFADDAADRIAYTRTVLLLSAERAAPVSAPASPSLDDTPRTLPPRTVSVTAPSKQILYFGATWCGPCQRMKRETFPVLKAAGWTIGGDVTGDVLVYDSDRDSAVAKRYGVKTVPTSILVERGAELRRLTSFASAARLTTFWGDNAPGPKPVVAGPRFNYFGFDLARHLVETHNLTPGEVAGLTHAELVQVHSDAHNEGR